ncbi:hypothetical protein M3568_11890 [Priestia flexa]|uniref:DUF5983 family protein n=1 Tax=Priestia flexa TaxID=86664 RepID=UPI002040A27C|nr:hypothetical protein [Priestia flexa]MCM3067121.1 hypothetical protein [Priestia flexa]
MNQENKTIEIEQMLVLSTHNITENDKDWLTHEAHLTITDNNMELIVYPKGQYGFFVPLHDGILENALSIPNTLAMIIGYAIGKGCSWIMFDRDVKVNTDLPSFEW